jgi:hypothetical protein
VADEDCSAKVALLGAVVEAVALRLVLALMSVLVDDEEIVD